MDEQRMVQKISAQVFSQYPEFSGTKPNVKWSQPNPGKDRICTLVFQTTVSLANGKSLNRRVKVVSTAEGKIQKITSSK
jgi:hypothetical protein